MMKSGFYYANPERKNPIKNLKILFKPKITIKNLKKSIIIKARSFGIFRVFGAWAGGQYHDFAINMKEQGLSRSDTEENHRKT